MATTEERLSATESTLRQLINGLIESLPSFAANSITGKQQFGEKLVALRNEIDKRSGAYVDI